MLPALFKSHKLQFLIFALFLIQVPHSLASQREGYSYLGIGTESIDYEESDDDLLGTGFKLETETKASLLAQRSGGFVAHDSGWGFYIQTEATIGNNTNDETWKINGVDVQENSFSLRRNELRVLVSKQINDRHAFLFGGAIQDVSFTRFDWQLSDQTQFQIEASQGSVSEEIFKLFVYGGYEIGDFFLKDQLGWNWQIQFLAGMPVFSQTLNTGFGTDTIDGGFDGYRAEINSAVGYRLTQNFMIGLALKGAYEHQDEIESDYSRGDGVTKRALPKNTMAIYQPNLTFYWSF